MSKCKDCQRCEKRTQEPKVHACRITGEVISPERLMTDTNCATYQENSWKFNRAKMIIERLVDELNAQQEETADSPWLINYLREDSRVELNEMLESLGISCRINDPDTFDECYGEDDE